MNLMHNKDITLDTGEQVLVVKYQAYTRPSSLTVFTSLG